MDKVAVTGGAGNRAALPQFRDGDAHAALQGLRWDATGFETFNNAGGDSVMTRPFGARRPASPSPSAPRKVRVARPARQWVDGPQPKQTVDGRPHLLRT